jgi:hypothetical protein
VNEILTYATMSDISNLCTVHDNADRITESAKCLSINKCQQFETGSVCEATLLQSHQNEPYQITMDRKSLY